MSPADLSPRDFHPTLKLSPTGDSRLSVNTSALNNSPSFSNAQLQTVGSNDSKASINTAHYNKMLANYSQEEVVYALMTHLREREGELKRITEHRNMALKQKLAADTVNIQLKGALNIQRDLIDAKEKTIQSLEQKLKNKESKDNPPAESPSLSPSSVDEKKIKELTNEILLLNEKQITAKTEFKRILAERDDKIVNLKQQIEKLSTKIENNDEKESVEHSCSLEQELDELESKLDAAENENSLCNARIEELKGQVRRKEWVIKALKEDNEDQRLRESYLIAFIRTLQQSIQSYETQFKGKDVDVPLVLAKLKDAALRNQELETKVKHMTVEFRKFGLFAVKGMVEDYPYRGTQSRSPPSSPSAELSLSSRNPLIVDTSAIKAMRNNASLSLDDEEASFTSAYDPFSPKANQDDISLLIQDVKDGIESIQNGTLCRCECAHGDERRDDSEDAFTQVSE